MKKRLVSGALLAALAFGPAAPSWSQAEPGPPPAIDDVSEDIGIGADGRERMTVPISIDGKGPYPFLIDTGAERTVISAELAKRLDLAAGRPARMHTMTGVGEVETVVIPTLQLSRKSVSDIHAPALRHVNIGAAGMLGIDSLEKQRVTFDFERQKMTVSPSKVSEPPTSPDEIIVRARSRFGRLVLVDATLEGQKLMVVLDTGSEVTVGNSALRSKLEARHRLPKTVPIDLISVTGDKITADYTQVKQVRLGGVSIRNLPVAFADVHPFKQLHLMDRPALLLGMDALRLFKSVSVDFSSRKVRFLRPDLSALGRPIRMAELTAPAK